MYEQSLPSDQHPVLSKSDAKQLHFHGSKHTRLFWPVVQVSTWHTSLSVSIAASSKRPKLTSLMVVGESVRESGPQGLGRESTEAIINVSTCSKSCRWTQAHPDKSGHVCRIRGDTYFGQHKTIVNKCLCYMTLFLLFCLLSGRYIISITRQLFHVFQKLRRIAFRLHITK